MIKYYRLFDLLNRRNMNKSDLLNIISSKTIAKLSKGANLNTEVIDKICLYLNCQTEDIMEIVESEHETNNSGITEMVKPYNIETEKPDRIISERIEITDNNEIKQKVHREKNEI